MNSGGITNTYDFENHLIAQGGATMVYDGDGNRVKKDSRRCDHNVLDICPRSPRTRSYDV